MFLTHFIYHRIHTPVQCIHQSPIASFLTADAIVLLSPVHVLLSLEHLFYCFAVRLMLLFLCIYIPIFFSHPCPVYFPLRCEMPMKGVMRFGKPVLLPRRLFLKQKEKHYPSSFLSVFPFSFLFLIQ